MSEKNSGKGEREQGEPESRSIHQQQRMRKRAGGRVSVLGRLPGRLFVNNAGLGSDKDMDEGERSGVGGGVVVSRAVLAPPLFVRGGLVCVTERYLRGGRILVRERG